MQSCLPSDRFGRVGLLGLWALIFLSGRLSAGQDLPPEIGQHPGLCVLIGAGGQGSAGLAATLAASGRVLVHGIALDEASLARAQEAIVAQGLEGLATVERLPLRPLPYRDHTANWVVVEDWSQAEAAGLTCEEALRVVVPNGRLCIRRDGRWDTTVKPRPPEMDEWTHGAHGPDGNRVSTDTLLRFPVGLRWHDGVPLNLMNPKRSSNAWSDTRGLALASGRCFILSTTVRENLGPIYHSDHGVDQYVTARDAYNGIFLWRHKVGDLHYGGLFLTNRAPLAAVGDYVYAPTDQARLVALDAATGQVAKTFDTLFVPVRLVVDRDTVVVAAWDRGALLGPLHGVDRRHMEYGIDRGAVVAFDVPSARRLWCVEKLATALLTADGNLYMLLRQGPDKQEEMQGQPPAGSQPTTVPTRPLQSVAAVDLRSGRPLWTVGPDVLGDKDHLDLDVAGLGVVAVTHNNGQKTTVLAARDGRRLLQVERNAYAALYQGLVHIGGLAFDPQTGQQVTVPTALHFSRTICTPQYYVNGILVNSRGCAYVDKGRPVLYGAARGGCLFAAVAANGAFYTPSNWCCCAPGQVPGFVSFGPVREVPTPEEMEKTPQVEPGPAFGKLTPQPAEDDWPLYRHDAGRSSATSAAAPMQLDVIWQRRVTAPAPDSPVTASWKDLLAGPLTAPVVAEGVVAMAATDRHQVVGLEAAGGKELWRVTLGGRIDTPPTIHGGACLVGSHDGWVYALHARDGRLAWKMRLAPQDRRLVSYGQVESPWPVIGTVLVSEGLAYASAGRTTESDGGIVVRAFEPATGRVVWSRATAAMKDRREPRQNDLLLRVGEAVQWMVTRLDPRDGTPRPNPTQEYMRLQPKDREGKTAGEIAPATGLEGFICWTWPRLGSRRSQAMSLGNVAGDQLSWDARLVCVNAAGRNIRAVRRESVGPMGQKPDPKAVLWAVNLPQGYQATSMALCANALVVGGGIYPTGAASQGGFVWVLSLDRGQKLAECRLDAPLAYNGLAVAAGRVYATLGDGSAVCLGKV